MNYRKKIKKVKTEDVCAVIDHAKSENSKTIRISEIKRDLFREAWQEQKSAKHKISPVNY